MTDRYVDGSGADGDGTQGNPWNNLNSALAGSINQDTIFVLTGVYDIPVDLNQGIGLFWIAQDGFGTVTVTTQNTSRLMRYGGISDLSNWTDFIFDGLSGTISGVNCDNGCNNKTFTTNRWLNFTGEALLSSNNSDGLQFIGNEIQGNGNAGGIDTNITELTLDGNTFSGLFSTRPVTCLGAKPITVINNTFNTSQAGATVHLLLQGSNVVVGDNIIDVSAMLSGANIIRAYDSAIVEISGNTITSNITSAHESIDIRSTVANTMSVIVNNNNIVTDSDNSICILIGTDNPSAGDGNIDGVIISNNIVSGALDRGGVVNGMHCIELGYNIGNVFGNFVSGGTFGLVMKGTQDFLDAGGCYGNSVRNCTESSSIRIKGDKNLWCANNSIYVNNSTASPNALIHSTVNTESANTPSNDLKLHNQIIQSNASSGRSIQIDTASSTGLVAGGNLFYTPNTTFLNEVAGVSYNTLADWNTFISGTDYEGDPLFIDPDNGNYELQINSPAIGIGVKYWGNGPRPEGENGEPYPDTEIDAGSNQSLHSIHHPGNPNFQPL